MLTTGENAMSDLSKDTKTIQIKLDVSELSPAQVRLIKTMNTLLVQTLTAPDETEYFDGASELMKVCASAIKQSHFPETAKGMKSINYADQALEYSMDNLAENLSSTKIVNFDN